VAEYLGHADLSTVHRLHQVAEDELHAAARAICARSPRVTRQRNHDESRASRPIEKPRLSGAFP
jgi:hypothetical protein